MTIPSIAKSGTSASKRKKYASLEADPRQVVEEARGMRTVQETLVEVVGTGGGPQEIGKPTMEVGTTKEDPGPVVEAVGDLRGIKDHQLATSSSSTLPPLTDQTPSLVFARKEKDDRSKLEVSL